MCTQRGYTQFLHRCYVYIGSYDLLNIFIINRIPIDIYSTCIYFVHPIATVYTLLSVLHIICSKRIYTRIRRASIICIYVFIYIPRVFRCYSTITCCFSRHSCILSTNETQTDVNCCSQRPLPRFFRVLHITFVDYYFWSNSFKNLYVYNSLNNFYHLSSHRFSFKLY